MVFAIALFARLLVNWELFRNNPGFYYPDVDSAWHYQWAQEIARGNWLGEGVFYRAPLYPYLLGLWMTVFGEGMWPIRIIQAIIGSSTAILITLVAWRVFGRRAGILSGIIWALWGPVIYYESEFLLEPMTLPLNLMALWLALGELKRDRLRLRPWLAVGLLLGISAIARPNILITVPVFLAMGWMAARRRPGVDGSWWPPVRPALALLLGLMIPILPVTIRNAVVGGDPVLIAYQGGVNLWIGNNPVADGLTMMIPEISLDATKGWDEFVGLTDSIAVSEAGRPLTPSEISSHWTGKALDYILANPGEAIGRWATKTYYLLNGFEVGDQTDIYAFRRFSPTLTALIWKFGIYFPFGLVGPLALVAMVWAWVAVRSSRWLTLFALFYAPSIIGFLATARHRLPLLPIAVILASGLVWQLWTWRRARRWKPLLVCIAAALALGVALNQSSVEQMMRDPGFTLYQEALMHDRQGNYKEAIRLYGEALNKQPMLLAARRNLALALVRDKQWDLAVAVSFAYLRYQQEDAEAYNNLGLAYLGQGDTSKAMGSFRTAARYGANLAQPHLNLGDIALARGDAVSAVYAYRTAIDADSTFGPAYNALGLLYAHAGMPDSAVAVLERCTQRNPLYPSAWSNLGNVLVEAGRLEEAIPPMKRAVELNPNTPIIRYNLAVAYWKLGRIDAAKLEVSEILARDPANEPARQLRDVIDKSQIP
ncbi:MAG: tetratricopeptide repeat protein [Candidatus Zixiibacteriota bacterium]